MYQSSLASSVCRIATEPTIVRADAPVSIDPVAEEAIASVETSVVSVGNKLDTLSAHTRNNFELFKVMFDAIKEISATQNNLSVLLVELLKKQDTTHDMLLEVACKKPEVVVASNPLPEIKRSFSSQLLKPKKKP